MSKASFNKLLTPALLALADGNIFPGVSIGYPGQALGEVVFNTSMTGYQEILTDPSYAEQMVTLTYPHIGNTGVNIQDQESSRIWAKGLIIRELSPSVSNYRSQQSLSDYLKNQRIAAIAQVDTRRLTRLLREKGAQNGCITTEVEHPEKAISAARSFPGLVGMDLAKVVSTSQTYSWTEKSWQWQGIPVEKPVLHHVVVYDFGVKWQILRLLADRGCKVTVVPAQTSAEEVLALHPHGIVLANGPGDPAVCDYAITAIQKLMDTSIPLLGICLGFQLLALASGGKTLKMKFGHHGANHPVLDIVRNRVMITSQNHGFSVDEASLPACWQVTHRSLFDGSLQGFQHLEKPVLGFQGHPEASPGPHDILNIFDQFVTLMKRYGPNA
jgi:carbamoyl-phosphate synthase small subunit